MENALKFETNPYHNFICKERKYLELSGVKNIERFDENEFLMETSLGRMLVKGSELILNKLDSEHGDVIIKGNIDSIEYTSLQKSHESIFSRLFK
ncbi:MAG: sporulation protein YabP [Traorella sp.]